MSPAAVSVAVVSYNTRDLLADCLASLEVEVDSGLAEVWVVDNGSDDGSPELVRRMAPWAKLLQPEANLGFGPAVNLVAERTTGEWLAPANADIALEPGALQALLDSAASPRTAVVSPRLVLPDGATQHSVYRFPTVPFTLAVNLGVYRVSRRLSERLLLESFWSGQQRQQVDWAIGAFQIIRRAAFDEVGGFDEDQWLFAEDLDLGWRLAGAGWETLYEPAAVVRHAGSAATAAAFGADQTARQVAATYATIARQRGMARTWATAAINWSGAAVRLAGRSAQAWFGRGRELAPEYHRGWLVAHRQGLRSKKRLLSRRPRPAGS